MEIARLTVDVPNDASRPIGLHSELINACLNKPVGSVGSLFVLHCPSPAVEVKAAQSCCVPNVYGIAVCPASLRCGGEGGALGQDSNDTITMLGGDTYSSQVVLGLRVKRTKNGLFPPRSQILTNLGPLARRARVLLENKHVRLVFPNLVQMCTEVGDVTDFKGTMGRLASRHASTYGLSHRVANSGLRTSRAKGSRTPTVGPRGHRGDSHPGRSWLMLNPSLEKPTLDIKKLQRVQGGFFQNGMSNGSPNFRSTKLRKTGKNTQLIMSG